MPPPTPQPRPSAVPIREMVLALFKHRKKLIACVLIGALGAALVYYFDTPVYESQAKLLVRYVVDRNAVDIGQNQTAGTSRFSETTINTEVEILTSWYLALGVAQKITPELVLTGSKLPPSKGLTTEQVAKELEGLAAAQIAKGLTVTSRKGSNVIYVSYKHPDHVVATQVLDELLKQYFVKHVETHRPEAALVVVKQRNNNLRSGLKDEEEKLKQLRSEAGIISVAEGTTTLNTELAKAQDQVHTAKSQLAEQDALVRAMESALGATPPDPAGSPGPPAEAKPGTANGETARSPGEPTDAVPSTAGAAKPVEPGSPAASAASPQISPADVEKYQALMARLTRLRAIEYEQLAKFTPESQAVKSTQSQIEALEAERHSMEKQFPILLARAQTAPGRESSLPAERARRESLIALVGILESQLSEVQARVVKFRELLPQIVGLERDKELDEQSYKYIKENLEKADLDKDFDTDGVKIPNINAVQAPTPGMRVTSARDKVMIGLAAGGLVLGVALALLLEMVWNRTVKRPLELQGRLQIPLMLSIPYLRQKRKRLSGRTAAKNGDSAVAEAGPRVPAPWQTDHFIRPFSEVVRDRLAGYFEVNGLDHKPKLIGVAGFSEGAGGSTLAGGLAAALSETGDGKVLLVDMNVDKAEAHPFFKGKPAYALSAALESSSQISSAAENLYLATAQTQGNGHVSLGLKKFHALMPGLKASEYDYIIFDLPHLSQMSPTMTMAPYLDKLVLVVEAEKTDRDVVNRRYSELVSSQAKVSVVFNKARSYGPRWLEGEA